MTSEKAESMVAKAKSMMLTAFVWCHEISESMVLASFAAMLSAFDMMS